MFDSVRADIHRVAHSESVSAMQAIKCIVHGFGLQALLVYRFGRWTKDQVFLVRWILLPLYWLLHAWIVFAYDIDLDLSASIGAGLLIWHFGGIHVRECNIGEHCTIHQQVKLCPTHADGQGPVIGDRVWIGPHATVIGAYQVESGATIGAGAAVSQNVKSGTVVLGAPARVVQQSFDNSAIL